MNFLTISSVTMFFVYQTIDFLAFSNKQLQSVNATIRYSLYRGESGMIHTCKPTVS